MLQAKKSSVRLGKDTQCLRIGVQEDIFVSNHFQPFCKQKNLQLGLGMLVCLFASGPSFSLPYSCRHFSEDNLNKGKNESFISCIVLVFLQNLFLLSFVKFSLLFLLWKNFLIYSGKLRLI